MQYGRLLSALMLIVCAPFTQAGPITADSGWIGFCFGGSGSAAYAGCQNEANSALTSSATSGNAFTFNTEGSVRLTITDAFDSGDTFNVFNDTDLLFKTAAPTLSKSGVSNPDAALADAAYSSGSIILGAGSYSINIFADASPLGGGGAYLRLDSILLPEDEPVVGTQTAAADEPDTQAVSVDEPGTLALFGLALLVLGMRRFRRHH
ncbi:PEP-CTERM sorting domain-containing protein [Marinobacteraceae bacterium S3BR75-40.1]